MAAESLRLRGYTVVPCLDPGMLHDMRVIFDATVRAFPEFKPGADAHVMGGFGALANPASFHNSFVRMLREWCMYTSVEGLWREYVDTPGTRGARLEQIIDRMMLRPKGTAPTSESWHRDVAILPAGHEGDETFGGWLNLDDTPQFFHCVPGTHTQPLGAGKKGFATIADKELKAAYKAAYERVEIPPGYLLVFFEHIVHEVRATKAAHDMYRLFTGWRVTMGDAEPMDRRLPGLLVEQGAVTLKSGQTPPMYALLHWTNWTDRIVDFTERNIRPECTEIRMKKSGKEAGRQYRVVHRYMHSLQAYGMPMYPAYSPEERAIHTPGTRWLVLRPGSTSVRVEVCLYPEAGAGPGPNAAAAAGTQSGSASSPIVLDDTPPASPVAYMGTSARLGRMML